MRIFFIISHQVGDTIELLGEAIERKPPTGAPVSRFSTKERAKMFSQILGVSNEAYGFFGY